jgi:hypothetical protein
MEKRKETDIVTEFWQKWEKADCLERLKVLEKVSDRLLEFAQFIGKVKGPKKKTLMKDAFTQSLNSYFEDLYEYVDQSKRKSKLKK